MYFIVCFRPDGGGGVLPVAEVIHRTEGVAGAGKAAAGPIGEVSLLAVLTL